MDGLQRLEVGQESISLKPYEVVYTLNGMVLSKPLHASCDYDAIDMASDMHVENENLHVLFVFRIMLSGKICIFAMFPES